MNHFDALVKTQILWHRGCKKVRKEDGSTTLQLSLGDHCDQVNETFLQAVTEDATRIKLAIEQCPEISQEVCALLAKYVSPLLVEIHVIESPLLRWQDHLKRLLEACSNTVEVINLKRNKWVDDWVIEQLSVKFASCLVTINIEATSATDQALHHLGRRCLKLRQLYVTMCPKISDHGLEQLSRKVHLSNIHIAHNLNITDAGIESVISAAHDLESVELINCPQLTDRAIESMYEAVAAWGKRRNTKALSLQRLVLQDCSRLTAQSLVFIATAAPSLKYLDIRNCVKNDLVVGMKELEMLKCIEGLLLGPSAKLEEEQASDLMQSILFHIPSLKTLHLIELDNMDDDCVTEIIDGSLVLEELVIQGMPVGIHTVESICSNVPNLRSITIDNSSYITDPDVRCICSILLHMKHMRFSRCSQLTDEAFSRCAALNRLESVDLSYVSKKMTGVFLHSFSTAPLHTLTLDGIALKNNSNIATAAATRGMSRKERSLLEDSQRPKWVDAFAGMGDYMRQTLQVVSLRDCPHVETEDVAYLLSHLTNFYDFLTCTQFHEKSDPL